MQKARLRDKIPEILIEALSVVFAVLLALGVNEWRDRRANERLAERAREQILSEVRANLEELRSHGDDNREYLRGLQAALSSRASEAGESDESSSAVAPVRYSQSILSSSAWETTRATGVMRFLDFDWTLRVSRVYEVQALFLDHQARLVEAISGFDAAGEDLGTALSRIRNRMQTVTAYHQGLAEEYERLLAER